MTQLSADKMSELTLNEYGYTYLNVNDCWQGRRDANSSIYADKDKFDSSTFRKTMPYESINSDKDRNIGHSIERGC